MCPHVFIFNPTAAALPAQSAKGEAKDCSAVLEATGKQKNRTAGVSERNLLKFHTKKPLNTLIAEMLERHFFVFVKEVLLFVSIVKSNRYRICSLFLSELCKVLSC